MSLVHGKTANILWDAENDSTELQHGQTWTADVSQDVAEITSMQDTWQTFTGGFLDWTATVDCLLDSAGVDIAYATGSPNEMGDVAAKLELYFVYDTGDYKAIYGDAICTGVSTGEDKDGIATVSYTFQGSGACAWHSGAAEPTY